MMILPVLGPSATTASFGIAGADAGANESEKKGALGCSAGELVGHFIWGAGGRSVSGAGRRRALPLGTARAGVTGERGDLGGTNA